MIRTVLLWFLAFVPAAVCAQDISPADPHGLPGREPGTEQWVVELSTRSFDLVDLEAAIRSQDQDAVTREVAALTKACDRDQAGVVEAVKDLGGRVVAQFWIVNALAIEIRPTMLDALRRNPRVRRVWPDAVVEPAFIKTSTNASNHRVDGLHARGIRGKGITIAIMDTGLDADMASTGRPHRSFFVAGDPNNKTGGGIGGSRIVANLAFGKLGPEDAYGHGTGVAAIAAGETWLSSNGDSGHAPLAAIAGYGISNTVTGNSDFVTIMKAWQAIAADKVKYGIAVANNSFTGSPDPTNPSQQALDTTARIADIVVVVAAGNEGTAAQHSQSAANGLAVAAVTPALNGPNDHQVASFSSRGPIASDRTRYYPDLAANGVGTIMPKRDAESLDWTANGTSMASPQVAGAACLFRSVAKTASALETKAAILASTDSLAEQNPSLDRNAYGMGYLRDDRLIDIAQGKGLLQTVTVRKASSTVRVPLNVVEGHFYSVAIAWHRHDVTNRNWSNIDLSVVLSGQPQGVSRTPRNLYEKVVFRARTTGVAQIEIAGIELETDPLPVAVAAIEVPKQRILGTLFPLGPGCVGSGAPIGVALAVPGGFENKFGSSDSLYPFGGIHRLQQVYAQASVPKTLITNGLFFRQDESKPTFTRDDWVEIEVKLGASINGPANMSTQFGNNPAGPLTTVFTNKVVKLPNLRPPNGSISEWRLSLPLDRTFVWNAAPGRWLLLETAVHRSSGGSAIPLWVDAHEDPNALPGTRIVSLQPNATSGGIRKGLALVTGFSSPVGGVPRLTHVGVPTIGKSYRVDLDQAPKSSAALLLYGLSADRWIGFRLPLDLGPLGAPGCFLQVSIDVSVGLPITAQGTLNVDIPIPNAPELIQTNIFHQMLILDPKANRFGFTVSNALGGIVGG